MTFDAVVPITVADPSISACLYNTVTSNVVASVTMPAAGPVDLTLRFQSLTLQRTFADPNCPITRTLRPADFRLLVPRNASIYVQYHYETIGPATDLLGTGETGTAHFGVWIYFCADDGAPNCTWTVNRTNRLLVQLYYRFDKSSPSSIIRFGGHYLGPNPGKLQPVVVAAPATLPLAVINDPYGPVIFSATGGVPPYSWSSTTLPADLTLATNGVLGGTVAIGEGQYPIEFRVSDSFGQTATRRYLLEIAASRCTRDGCLSSATRQRLVGAIPPSDGCSVPSNLHFLGMNIPVPLRRLAADYIPLFKPACDTHDYAYSTYTSYAEFESARKAADGKFLQDMISICRNSSPSSTCPDVAVAFYAGVLCCGEENFRNAQFRESFCPECHAPSNLGPAGALEAPPAPDVPSPATPLNRGLSREGRGSVSAFSTAPLSAANAYRGVSGQFYTGPTPTQVDDAIELDGVELLERSSAAFVRYQLAPAPPPPEGVFDFAFAVLNHGDGDWLSVTLDGTVVWSAQTTHFERDVVYLAHVPATSLVTGGQLQFTLHNTGVNNAVVLLGDPDTAVFGFGEPQAPRNLRANVVGTLVKIDWDPVAPAPTHYVLEAATSPLGPAIATLPLGQSTTLTVPAPPGRYWVRVFAVNQVGSSPPSAEVEIDVVGCAPPVAPAPFNATAAGLVGTVSWTPFAGLSYTLEVGTAPGLSNLGLLPLPPTGSVSGAAPAGTYYVRLRASNACGVSPPSEEQVLILRNP